MSQTRIRLTRGELYEKVWAIREYADSLDPFLDLPDAIEEFVRPESKSWWPR